MSKNIPTAASFLITEDCNLNCLYCFEKDKHNKVNMSKDIIYNALDYLSSNAKEVANGKGFHAMIFGGEPLLVPDLIKYLLDCGLKFQKEKDIKFTATIITNATIMNYDVFWLLTEYQNKMDLSCQLSIDGDKDSHDLNRRMKSGKGTFDTVEENIVLFKKIYQNNPKRLNIHGCISKKTLPSMYKNYKYFKDQWGIDNIWFMPIHEEAWEEEDVEIYFNQLNKISDDLIEEAKRNKSIQNIKMFTPINKCVSPNHGKKTRLCGAGANFVSITAKGDIYPCHLFYFNDKETEMKIGDVWNGIDEEAEQRKNFLSYDVEKVSCPSDCEHVHCYRCMGINWLVNGDPLEQVRGNYCAMAKKEKIITDKMKEEIASLDFIDLNDKNYMKFEKSWVEDGYNYEKYFDSIGQEHIFKQELNEEQKEQVKKYYDENTIEILANGMKLLLEKVDNIEKQISN